MLYHEDPSLREGLNSQTLRYNLRRAAHSVSCLLIKVGRCSFKIDCPVVKNDYWAILFVVLARFCSQGFR